MMNTQTVSRTVGSVAVGRAAANTHAAPRATPLMRAELQQRIGQRMIMSGFAVTILGIVGYCLACFAAGTNAGVAEIMFADVVPFARATLVVLGIGSALWLVGSFTYLNGAMIADEATAEGPAPTTRD